MLDVAVAGAGPIGLVAARCAALQGARVAIFERKARLAPPSCCAGLVSPRTLPVLGVSDRAVLRSIHAVRVHSPMVRSVELRAEAVKALVIDRAAMERELRQLAQDAGVELHFLTEVVEAKPGWFKLQTAGKARTIEARILIGADGPHSKVAQALGLDPPHDFVLAEQAEISCDDAGDQVSVYLGRHLSPDFFGWSVPAQAGVLRVGLAVADADRLSVRLDRLLETHYPLSTRIARRRGEIPLGMPSHITAERALLVGDAAGQTKPLSGGGLFTGGVCARLAGFLAARAARAEDPGPFLQSYGTACLGILGREQAFGLAVRQLRSRMGDAELDTAIKALDSQPLLNFVAAHADIDNFHKLADRLARHPQWWGALVQLIPSLLRSVGEDSVSL